MRNCVLAFLLAMAIYRYRPESIDSLSRRIRRHHLHCFLIFTAVVCAAEVARMELLAALILDAAFSLVAAVVFVSRRNRALQRTADWLRSNEFEIDGEKVSFRNNVRETAIYRSEIGEACFSESGIWLRRKSSLVSLQIPPEVEDFDRLSALLNEWLPQYTIRRNSPPSSVWPFLRLYGVWSGAALLLYAAMASQTRFVAIPACVLTAIGIAWYFAWCGHKISERKWKVLLPLSGFMGAAALLGRAVELWIIR